MKRLTSMFLAAVLLLGMCACLPFTASAEGKKVDPTAYTYEVIPLLEPFNMYFYIKTDNPDPTSFRFIDRDSVYQEEGREVLLEPYVYSYTGEDMFADVVYEDRATKRVKGGYIFDSYYTDGGEITLQKVVSRDYWGDPEWGDTDVTLTLPPLCDRFDYLIDTYSEGDGFFDQMYAIQDGLRSICLYSDHYIKGSLAERQSYWTMYRSPHIDQTYYIGSAYARRENQYLLSCALYPYIWDSLSFPSALAIIACRLDDSVTWEWSSTSHSTIEVTYHGETRSYGGAGSGKGQGLAKDQIMKTFAFGEEDMGITFDGLRELHQAYSQLEVVDDAPTDGALTWKEVSETAGNNGAWACMTNGFAYLYKRNDRDTYGSSPAGDAGGSYYTGGSLGYASNVWVDGRHVSRWDMYQPGVTFEDYPTDDVGLTDVTYPVINYDEYYRYDRETETYYKEYYILSVTERTGYLQYAYNEEENTWDVQGWPSFNDKDFSYFITDYAKTKEFVELGLIDESYLDGMRLTYEQVMEMDLDKNTDLPPERGYNYNGATAAGTPFDRSAIRTEDPSVLFADAKAIAEENGLRFRLDEGCYGMCGNDLYWVYLEDSQTLIISGEGEMMLLGEAQWFFSRIDPKRLIIGEGVTSLQDEAFFDCRSLEEPSLPSTLERIGWSAFQHCDNLKRIVIPDGVTYIGGGAFQWCRSLQDVEIPASVVKMGENAFNWCDALLDIYCLAKAQPEGWNANWLGNCTAAVRWGTAMPDCKHENTVIDRLDATCTSDGYEDLVCADCGRVLEHQELPNVHGFVMQNYRKDATCTEDGYDRWVCYFCGDVVEEVLYPATGHQHVSELHRDVTCTEDGYDKTVCEDCGAVFSEKIDPAPGHDFQDGVCTRCGASPFTLGDVNGNGEIEATDYLLLKRHCLGTFNLTVDQQNAADINGDGEINALDYMLVKRHVLGTYKIA